MALTLFASVASLALIVFREPVKRELRKHPLAYAIARGPWNSLNEARDILRTRKLKRQSGALIDEYLGHHSVRKLQIGSGGNNLDGWLNTDIEPRPGQAYLDATRPFPIPDGTFGYITSEHVFEHLTYPEGRVMLAESYRILRPGGRIRIATPNLLRLVGLFQADKSDETKRYLARKIEAHGWPSDPNPECFILNLQLSSFGHRFVYYPGTLRSSLAAVGFQSIGEFALGESDDAELRGVEVRNKGATSEMNAFETMVLQAVRP